MKIKNTLLSIVIIVVSFSTYSQVGIGTTSPEGPLDIVSTNSGFVFPRVANAAAVTTPVNGMAVYDLSLNCFNFYENGIWSGCLGNSTFIETPAYCTGSATAIVDVTSPYTGKTWMDRNLGATQAATSSTDTASYGDLYQWGRFGDGHQCRTSITTVNLATTSVPNHGYFLVSPSSPNDWLTPQDGNLWQGVDGVNNPCPSGYRLPTEAELNVELLFWTSKDLIGALESPLQLPTAGFRDNDGDFYLVGTHGYYWSSTVSGTSAVDLAFHDIAYSADSYTLPRGSGASVRCTKNIDNLPPTPVYCTGSATAIVNVTNPITGKTWMDRNLGATQAATSSTDTASYGDLYQWGRFTDGHQCRTSGTTTTLVTTSAPDHGDFIVSSSSPNDWLTPQNGNLWQGVNGVNNPCPAGYRIPTETELNNERLSWSPNNNATGAFGSPLKLPVAGYRSSNGTLTNVGTDGYYWSDTVSSINAANTSDLYLGSSNALVDHNIRARGYAVRCTKNVDNPPPTPTYCTGSATTIVDVTNPITGKTWMDRNLGATQAATSSTDTASYGDLYQWGRFTDGHQCRTSDTTTTLATTTVSEHDDFILSPNSPNDWLTPQNDNLWQGIAGANSPCPSGYRLPTDTELNNELTLWGSNNAAGAFGSPLKLPAAGTRINSDGTLYNVDNAGYYRSSTVSGASLTFYIDNALIANMHRAYGMSVRCTKNIDNVPRTPTYCSGGSATAIVDVTNPTTGKTWMDRNLGATQAATSSTDTASYGDLYQWGRFTDGHQCSTSGTTTVLATTTAPNHGDFILSPNSPNDWLTPQNDNLWQGIAGTNNPCPSGYRVPTYAELDLERLSWATLDTAGAFGSPLKLPVAGFRASDNVNNGWVILAGANGYYWSSTVTVSGTSTADLAFSSDPNSANMYTLPRVNGASLRCIKD